MIIPYFRTDGWVKSVQGAAVPGAQIYVCTQPANIATVPPTPLANIFSDVNGLVPITQPILTDGFGHYDFYATAAVYTIVVANSGLVQQVYPDQSVGGASGTSGAGGTALMLQVNGTANVDQFLLNLQGQNSTVVSDAGNGTVNITGAVFQTGGVPNTLQTVHNLIAGSNVTITSDAFGGTTIAAAGASFSGSAAFMYGPGVRDIGTVFGGNWGAPLANSVAGAVTANKVTVYLFQLDVSITISKASASCTNNTIGPTASFGIYSFAGNKLVDAGSFNCLTSPAVQTNSFTPVTLPPGIYWHAQACTTTSSSCTFTGITVSNGANNDSIPLYVKNATRCATATNVMSGGVLPSTLGTLTPFTPLSAQGDGFCAPLYE